MLLTVNELALKTGKTGIEEVGSYHTPFCIFIVFLVQSSCFKIYVLTFTSDIGLSQAKLQ